MENKNEKVDLTLVDLKNLLIILDYAANNGLFKGWETMKNVISLRERLDAFVKANEKYENMNENTGTGAEEKSKEASVKLDKSRRKK
jgi:hypothetical protein